VSNGSGSSIYKKRAWRAIRLAALRRAGWKCQIRLNGCTERATQGDHIVELEDGGEPFSLSNTQAACRACNVAKGNKARDARLRRTLPKPSREW
jgi:5-methylcytosine-specific restriction enzyme A